MNCTACLTAHERAVTHAVTLLTQLIISTLDKPTYPVGISVADIQDVIEDLRDFPPQP